MNESALLSDADYERFLTDGYVVVQPSAMTADDHERLFVRAQHLYAQTRATKDRLAHLETLGDNLRATVPEVDRIVTDPAVVGVLTSLLGSDYLLHPHHFVHRSSDVDQGFHQDGNLPWNERGHYRSHRPDWAILFYYPQDVSRALGPTEIVAGSQYWTKDFEDGERWHPGDPMDRSFDRAAMTATDLDYRDRRLAAALDTLGIPNLDRRFIEVPRGSIVIGNYDLIHRGTRAEPDAPDRFMYKFYFARTREPRGATWRNTRAAPALNATRPELRPVVSSIWRWAIGQIGASTAAVDLVAARSDLYTGREDERVAAAYRLGNVASADCVALLGDALACPEEGVRRAAAYGLRAAGSAGIETALSQVDAPLPGVRRMAVFALGHSATASVPEALFALTTAVATDVDVLVRSNAAYALGQALRAATCSMDTYIGTLIERLEPGQEPDNTEVALLPRSTVRQSVAYALVLAAANDQLSTELFSCLFEVALPDDDRYVEGFVVEAGLRGQAAGVLSASDTQRLLRHLAGRRFNQRPREVDGAAPLSRP
ncbi:MAG: hypothetical protein AAF515_09350 [Pseudomonadota bacterium]